MKADIFDRKELLRSKEYWLTRLQAKLYSLIHDYMTEKNLNRTDLAKQLGVSKGYITQVLNGDFDHRLSKFVELALAADKVPRIYFEDIEQVYADDDMGLLYEEENSKRPIIHLNVEFEPYHKELEPSKHGLGMKKNLGTTLKWSRYTTTDFDLV